MTKSNRILGFVLAILLFIAAANSTNYFLNMLRVSVVQWLMFNACAPSIAAYLLGFIVYYFTKNRMWLAIAVVPIFFFGTMGLFVFPWNGMNCIAQVSHILMTLNILWALVAIIHSADYKALGIGLLTSIAVFIPLITVQQYYCRIHADDLIRILQIH